MHEMPRDPLPESTLALLRDGYAFIDRRSRRFQSDVFRTRLLLQPTICMTGAEAASVFYDPARFHRAGAAPSRLTGTLTGEGGVQGLDGDEHSARKAMFMSLMAPGHLRSLGALSEAEWEVAVRRWNGRDAIVLLREAEEVLCRTAFEWAGVPLAAGQGGALTRDLVAMIDAPGAVGPRYLRGVMARKRAERWAAAMVHRVRHGTAQLPGDSALSVIASARGNDGRPLSLHDAAVEFLNIVRPIVAVARYVAFLAVALHAYPTYRDQLKAGDLAPEAFVHEVRRFYPFFPFVAARVSQDFEWQGMRFPASTRTLLDLYGTNRDPRLWTAPGEFRPERFDGHEPGPFDLIPQGGGDHYSDHRCAGEWATIELMKTALRFLVSSITYEVPPQDLRIDLGRVPAQPASGFVMRNVRLRH